jgi:hypothetical protein
VRLADKVGGRDDAGCGERVELDIHLDQGLLAARALIPAHIVFYLVQSNTVDSYMFLNKGSPLL